MVLAGLSGGCLREGIMDYRRRSSWAGKRARLGVCVCCGSRYHGLSASGCCSDWCAHRLDRWADQRTADRVFCLLAWGGLAMMVVTCGLLFDAVYSRGLGELVRAMGG